MQNSASSPGPCRVPSGVRDTSTPWWKSKSSTSKKASPAGARALSPQKAQPGQASVGCFANGQGANGQVANGHSGAISTIEVSPAASAAAAAAACRPGVPKSAATEPRRPRTVL